MPLTLDNHQNILIRKSIYLLEKRENKKKKIVYIGTKLQRKTNNAI